MKRTPIQRGETGDPRLAQFTTDQLETSAGVLLCDIWRDEYRDAVEAIVGEIAEREQRPFQDVLAEFLVMVHK